MKRLMLGNEAVARGLYEAGCRVISSYPGTPSTEISEYASKYEEIYAEWAPNEKVAAEVALGASFGGARSFCAMKHVGLNVAADPLFTSSYTGVNGGMIYAVADDPGMHSSQNEQDSRHYAMAAKLPMLEPSDSKECRDFIKEAYEISEKYDTPVLFRLSTRVSHSQSIVEEGVRKELPLKNYVKNPQKYVMMPAFAKSRHIEVENRLDELSRFAEKTELNRLEWADKKIGVICSGITYQYVKEALGDRASVLKLGLIYPLPEKLIRDFVKQVDRLYVIEELDDIFETQVKKLGISCEGKALFTRLGEYSPQMIAEKILDQKTDCLHFDEEIPARPPAMCPGCPHRGLYYVLSKLGVMVSGDIGCYTLGATAPLNAMDSCVCMGASISALHGFNKARNMPDRSVAVIGDSTFMHSGMTGLVNIGYNKGNSTVIILDNRITGMTGHQENPTTGRTLKGEEVPQINIEAVCRAAGISRVTVVDPYNVAQVEAVLKEELASPEPSVIISRRPCVLLKSVPKKASLLVDAQKCRTCRACFKVGCPAIHMEGQKAAIDPTLCVGCGLCASLCPFHAIGSLGGAEK